jgi:hypothetical protein
MEGSLGFIAGLLSRGDYRATTLPPVFILGLYFFRAFAISPFKAFRFAPFGSFLPFSHLMIVMR